jgi:hypothetical protein
LPALPARDGQQRNVVAESTRKIRERAARFVIGMRGNEQDAGGNARALNSFERVGQALSVRVNRGALRKSGNRECG